MSLTHLLSRTVTVVRPGMVPDPYGGPDRPDWSTATRADYPGWLEQSRGVEESGDGRLAAVSDWLLVLDRGVDIVHGDRVEAEGATFEVAGPPDRVHTPRGPHHIEARLRLVEP